MAERRTRDLKVIERLRVRVPAGAAGEFSLSLSLSLSLRDQLCVLTLISVSVSPPCHLLQYEEDPGHSSKSAGGRLRLHMHP